MATAAENLQTAYNQLAARLADLTAKPKPTYSIDGETVNWTEYQQMLLAQMATLRAEITAAAGPFEVRSRGVT